MSTSTGKRTSLRCTRYMIIKKYYSFSIRMIEFWNFVTAYFIRECSVWRYFDQLKWISLTLSRTILSLLPHKDFKFSTFYILIINEKVLNLCEKWLSEFSSSLYTIRFETSWVRKNDFHESVCLSSGVWRHDNLIELSNWIKIWHTLSEPKK